MAGEIKDWAGLLAYVSRVHKDAKEFPAPAIRFLHHRDPSRHFLAWPLSSPSGRPWIALALKLGSGKMLRGRGSLVGNGRLPIGAIVLMGDEVVVRQTLPMTQLSVATLEHTLDALLQMWRVLTEVAELPVGAETDIPFAYVFQPRRD